MRLGRNYLILCVIYIFTILGVFYFSRIYSNSSHYYKSDVGILDITSSKYDVLFKNVLNYASENDNFVIYVSNGDSFSGDDLYINVDGLSKFSDLNRLLNEFGARSVRYDELPIYVAFNGGRIVSVSSEVVE